MVTTASLDHPSPPQSSKYITKANIWLKITICKISVWSEGVPLGGNVFSLVRSSCLHSMLVRAGQNYDAQTSLWNHVIRLKSIHDYFEQNWC